MAGGVVMHMLAQNGFQVPGDWNLWIVVAIGIIGAVANIFQTIGEKAKERGPLGTPVPRRPTRPSSPVRPPVERRTLSAPGHANIPERVAPSGQFGRAPQRPVHTQLPSPPPGPRTATGKSSGERISAQPTSKVKPSAAPVPPKRMGEDALRRLLRNRAVARTGFVLSEILAPPVSLREDHLRR